MRFKKREIQNNTLIIPSACPNVDNSHCESAYRGGCFGQLNENWSKHISSGLLLTNKKLNQVASSVFGRGAYFIDS